MPCGMKLSGNKNAKSNLKLTHQLVTTIIIFLIHASLYLAGFLKMLPPNRPLLSSSCFGHLKRSQYET